MIDAQEQSVSPDLSQAESEMPEFKSRKPFFARLFTYLAIPFFAAVFAAIVYFLGGKTLLELIPPAISVLFFAAVTLRLIPAVILRKDASSLPEVGERSQKRLHPRVRIIFFSLFAQLLILLAVYAAHSIINGFDSLLPEGIVKLFALPRGLAFGENTRSVASSLGLLSFVLPQHLERMANDASVCIPLFAANALAVAASAVFLYELVICDRSKRRAKFSVLIMHILPSVLLLLQPFSGTAFSFAFSLLSLLLARRGRLLFAGITAFAASLFNIFAVLLVVPIVIEWRMHYAKTSSDVKTVKSVFGVIIALLPAAIGAILKSVGLNGLSALEANGAFHLNPIGALLSAWNGGAVPRAMIIVSLVALLLIALIIFFGARFARSSNTAFALVFTIVPGILALTADSVLYSVFALPILASLIGEKCSFKAARSMTAIASLAVLMLFIVFLYIKRTA